MSGEPDWLKLNRDMWDERVPIHVAGEFYDVDSFLSGRSPLRAFRLWSAARLYAHHSAGRIHLEISAVG